MHDNVLHIEPLKYDTHLLYHEDDKILSKLDYDSRNPNSFDDVELPSSFLGMLLDYSLLLAV